MLKKKHDHEEGILLLDLYMTTLIRLIKKEATLFYQGSEGSRRFSVTCFGLDDHFYQCGRVDLDNV
jgi:hypothetical protein